MTMARARVIKAAQLGAAVPAQAPAPRAKAVVLKRAVYEATLQAQQRLAAASAAADRIVRAAEQAAAELRLQAQAEGRAEGVLELAALRIAHGEQQARDRAAELGRSVELAQLLAEQLIGETLKLDPGWIARTARRLLEQHTRARLTLRVHPGDHPVVEKELQSLALHSATLSVDPTLQPGELCLDSDLGSLQLRWQPGLERLVNRLKSLLGNGS